MLENLLQHWQQTVEKAYAAAARLEVMEPMSAPVPLTETAALAPLAGRLGATERLLGKYRQGQANLADLAEPPATFEVLPLEQLLQDLRFREDLQCRAHHRQETLASLSAPADLAPVGDLVGLIAILARLLARSRQLEGLAGTLGVLTAGPEMAPTQNLEELIGQTDRFMKEISQKQQGQDSLEKALVQKRAEVAGLIQEAGLCPLCGSPMDVAHFLEAVHG